MHFFSYRTSKFYIYFYVKHVFDCIIFVQWNWHMKTKTTIFANRFLYKRHFCILHTDQKSDDSRQEHKGNSFRTTPEVIQVEPDLHPQYRSLLTLTSIHWNGAFYSVIFKLSKPSRCSYTPIHSAVCHAFSFLFYEWPLHLCLVFIEFLTFSQILQMRSKIL